jgi:hypothetical protein
MMFTIKYRFYALSPLQSPEGPFYDQCESCHGPFETVSQERDANNCIVVHGIDPAGQPMTFGAVARDEQRVAGQPPPRPVVWVMNDAGATIAKYDL